MHRLAPRLLGLLATAWLVGNSAIPAHAQAKKRYHFELTAVTPKPEVKADIAKIAVGRVEGQVKKTFESHPQLVGTLDADAPPREQAIEFRKYLARKGLSGAYLVTVEITDASEELTPTDKPNTQRLSVRIAVHLLGETIPGRTMGFTGDGKATIKQEVGKKVRELDRNHAWDSAAELAIADAMTTVFKQLAVPPKKQ